MANWEKLIEEHYSKKNKIDENTIFELIEQALIAEGYQDSEVIKNHPSMRLSTKGTKKAGGEPYDEDPPKNRSKSAPAGFGVLEEEVDAELDAKVLTATKEFVKANNPDVNLEDITIYGDPKERKIGVPTFLRQEAGLMDALKSILQIGFPDATAINTLLASDKSTPIGYVVKSGKRNLAKYVYKPFGKNINKGDIAEGILGAALYVKFMNPESKVTGSAVKKVLEKINAEPDAEKSNPKKVDKTLRGENGEDKISFRVALSTGNYEGLVDPKWHSELSNHYKSAVAYVNGEAIVDQAMQQEMDKNPNVIEVISDGVSNQTGTKVDVQVKVDGKFTKLGSISLKAGSKTMGQVGSGNWNKLSGLLSDMFGVKPDSELEEPWTTAVSTRDKAAVIAAGQAVYNDIVDELAREPEFRRDNPEDQVDVIQSIINGVRKAATGGEQGVLLVDFDGGDYKVLNFDDKLEDVFRRRENFKLGVKYTQSSSGFPKILIRDDGNNETLIEIRMRVEGKGETIKNVRHYVEKTRYLGKLLDIAERLEKEDSQEEK
jgi:hypothetical protein